MVGERAVLDRSDAPERLVAWTHQLAFPSLSTTTLLHATLRRPSESYFCAQINNKASVKSATHRAVFILVSIARIAGLMRVCFVWVSQKAGTTRTLVGRWDEYEHESGAVDTLVPVIEMALLHVDTVPDRSK